MLQSVRQADRVFTLVAGRKGIRLEAIAHELGLAKATAYRLVTSWANAGFLQRDQSGLYWLGWRMHELASRHLEGIELRDICRPIIKRLSDEHAETVHLAVLDGFDVVYIDKIEGRQPIRVYSAVGYRAPPHASATGKAIMAYRDVEFVTAYIGRGLDPFTDRTICDPERLTTSLALIRERGYSLNEGEWHREVSGVGAPIFNHDAAAVAAVSVTFPSSRFTPELAERFARDVVKGAAEASARLGHHSAGPRTEHPAERKQCRARAASP